jgi:hypothetical protein
MGGTSHNKALQIEHYDDIVADWRVRWYIECDSMVGQTEMAKGNKAPECCQQTRKRRSFKAVAFGYRE